jgi:glutamate synthase (NADPH) small chain
MLGVPGAARERPPEGTRWPLPPKRMPTAYALEEGGERRFGAEVTAILGSAVGQVGGVRARHVEGISSRDMRARQRLGGACRPGS